jgi:hypothetical protein
MFMLWQVEFKVLLGLMASTSMMELRCVTISSWYGFQKVTGTLSVWCCVEKELSQSVSELLRFEQ